MWEDGERERETGRREEWSVVALGKYCEERSKKADTLYLQQVKQEKKTDLMREKEEEREREMGERKEKRKTRQEETSTTAEQTQNSQ